MIHQRHRSGLTESKKYANSVRYKTLDMRTTLLRFTRHRSRRLSRPWEQNYYRSRGKDRKSNGPRCGQESSHPANHRYLEKRFKYKPSMVSQNRRQFKCHIVVQTFSEELSFWGEDGNISIRYATILSNKSLHSDTHNVAVNNDLTGLYKFITVKLRKKIDIDLEQSFEDSWNWWN